MRDLLQLCSVALILTATAFLGACGDKAHDDDHSHDHDGGGHAAAINGAGWDGGSGFDPEAKSDKVRAIAFFKPG